MGGWMGLQLAQGGSLGMDGWVDKFIQFARGGCVPSVVAISTGSRWVAGVRTSNFAPWCSKMCTVSSLPWNRDNGHRDEGQVRIYLQLGIGLKKKIEGREDADKTHTHTHTSVTARWIGNHPSALGTLTETP